jgi:hypothetical protein
MDAKKGVVCRDSRLLLIMVALLKPMKPLTIVRTSVVDTRRGFVQSHLAHSFWGLDGVPPL